MTSAFISNDNVAQETLFNYALPDDKILDWSELKQIADDILKFQ